MKHKLEITPAIDMEDLQVVQASLQNLGYDIIGSGEFTDHSSCDISFEDNR